MAAEWSVTVDEHACIGSGMCTSTAPGRFALTEGRAHAVDARTGADQAVVAAAESCPTEAITVVEISSGEVLAGPE